MSVTATSHLQVRDVCYYELSFRWTLVHRDVIEGQYVKNM